MQEQGCDTSVIAASSSTPTWWELHSTYPHSSWAHLMMNNIPWNPSNNRTSNSSCEDDISISTTFTNAGSNQSSLTTVDSPHHEFVESSASADLLGEPASDNHLWNQVLLTIGSSKDAIRNGQDMCENFVSSFSSKSLANSDNMFELSSDCLKKVGNTSEDHTSSNSFIDKQLNHDQFEHSTRLNNLPDMVRNWSIAPPEPYVDSHVTPNTCNISSNSISMDRYLESNAAPTNANYFPSYGLRAGGISSELGAAQSFKHENDQNCFGYNNMGFNNSALGLDPRYFYGVSDQVPNMSHARHFTDVISFGGSMKPAGLQPSNSTLALKGQVAQDRKKLALPDVSALRCGAKQIKGNARGSGPASDQGRKRKSEALDSSFKKPKSGGSSTASSSKAQVPKAKLGERITVLQQIVSPFGKTDTASVLYETIGFIKFLHEQVQLLSNPYSKSGVNKDHCAWGGLERKENLEARFDLKSRGLCLVPVSCTPQAYKDNSGPDYLTPTYRGCLYR